MDIQLREAIETSDSAKQHKCHLEEKQSALKTAIEQVVQSAAESRKNIVNYFEDLKDKLAKVSVKNFFHFFSKFIFNICFILYL